MRERISVMLDEKTVAIMRKRMHELGIPISRTMNFAIDEYLEKIRKRESAR